MKTMIVRKRKKRTVTDREKFDAWLALCPVTVRKTEDFAHGWIDITVSLPDEDND